MPRSHRFAHRKQETILAISAHFFARACHHGSGAAGGQCGGHVCTVHLEATATVAELKAAIEAKAGIPAVGQRLFHALQELRGRRSLGEQLPHSEATPAYELLLVRRPAEQTKWLLAVAQDGHALRRAPAEVRADRVVVTAAVARNPSALAYASAELKNDREVVLAAVRRDGETLAYASPARQDDRAVVLAAIAQDADALRYASAARQAELYFL